MASKFLEKNGQRKEIITTPSGLQYEIIDEGIQNSQTPTLTDMVTVHYTGTFTNNKEFDSSYSRNEPAVFPVNGVISGWTEGLQLMTKGSVYKFYIPAELAYGNAGIEGVIPPKSTLIFEVELLDIRK